MLEQVKDRTKAEVKKVLIEVCCGENSKLATQFNKKEEEKRSDSIFQHTMFQRIIQLKVSKEQSKSSKKKDLK